LTIKYIFFQSPTADFNVFESHYKDQHAIKTTFVCLKTGLIR